MLFASSSLLAQTWAIPSHGEFPEEMYPLFTKVAVEAFTPIKSCNESSVLLTKRLIDIFAPMLSSTLDDVLTSEDCCKESKTALINLFSNLYPIMLDTKVATPNGAVMIDSEDRIAILNYLASRMLIRMKDACSYAEERTFGTELSKTLKEGVNKGSYSSTVVEQLDSTFKTLNIHLTFVFGI